MIVIRNDRKKLLVVMYTDAAILFAYSKAISSVRSLLQLLTMMYSQFE